MTTALPPDEGADVTALSDAALDAALAQTDQLLRPQLAELFTVPAGLEHRTRTEVRQALLNRSTAAAATDVLGVGWLTMRLLFGDVTPAEGHDPRRSPDQEDPS